MPIVINMGCGKMKLNSLENLSFFYFIGGLRCLIN